ncbi:Poly(A) polymerase [Binucleata daphniae]
MNTRLYKSKNNERTITKNPAYFLKKLQTPLPLPGIEKLNIELMNLYKKLLPQPEELIIRKELINKITKFIKTVLPEYDVHTFGSTKANTFLPNSDIDIVLIKSDNIAKNNGSSNNNSNNSSSSNNNSNNSTNSNNSINNSSINNNNSSNVGFDTSPHKRYKTTTSEPIPNKILSDISKKIHNASFLDQSYVLHIKQARVPLLKLRDKTYGIEFDIIVNKSNSINQANYMCSEIEKKPYLKSMILLLKHFLKSRALNDSRFGGLCSYAQFLMLLSFAQLHPILQQKNINPKYNLGVLFLDFFQFYGFDFPYETVTISVVNKSYNKKSISNSIISIEDPIDTKHDVGDNCIQMYSIKEVFQHAYKIMTILLKDRIEAKESLVCVWMNFDVNQEKWRRSNIEKYKKNN